MELVGELTAFADDVLCFYPRPPARRGEAGEPFDGEVLGIARGMQTLECLMGSITHNLKEPSYETDSYRAGCSSNGGRRGRIVLHGDEHDRQVAPHEPQPERDDHPAECGIDVMPRHCARQCDAPPT